MCARVDEGVTVQNGKLNMVSDCLVYSFQTLVTEWEK